MQYDIHQTREGRASKVRLLRRCAPFVLFLLLVAGGAHLATPALAQVDAGLDVVERTTALGGDDIRIIVARIIRSFLGLLGIVGVVIVLYGGFLWMTAGGEEDKLATAKRILVNGAIGLIIVLSAFAIAQFVLSKLVEATRPSEVQSANEGGVIPLSGLPGGCVDPGGTDPYICSLSPLEGPVGSYVTLRGYRFGTYGEGSSVRFGNASATIVACSDALNWREHRVVVEVPQLDPGSVPVALTTSDNRTTTFAVGLASGFAVTTAPLGPQVACVIPDEGPEGTSVRIEGKRFGDPEAAPPPVAPVPAENPTIASVQPMRASRGQFVTIMGSGFGSTGGQVRLTNEDARRRITQTSMRVPAVCGSRAWKDDHVIIEIGAVVSNPSNNLGFTVHPPAPNASGRFLSSNFYPNKVPPPFDVVAPSAVPIPGICDATGAGGMLTVVGSNFGSAPGTLMLGGVTLPVTAWSDRTITATLPAQAASGALVAVWRTGDDPSNVARRSNPIPAAITQRCQADGGGCGVVQFAGGPEGGISADTTAWSDTVITASVPAGANTGDVVVTVDERASNDQPFRVTCGSNSDCTLTGCCIANACFEESACATRPGPTCTTTADCPAGLECDPATNTCTHPNLGDPCDADSSTEQCTPDAAKCGTNLTCSTRSCTCVEPPGPGESCDADLTADACQPGTCVTGFACSTESCTCTAVRVGDPCDADSSTEQCTPDATKCGTGFTCHATTCTCAAVTGTGPTILAVSAAHHVNADGSLGAACTLTEDQTACTPNGAPGNYLTIRGGGFGTTRGTVTIGGVTAGFPSTNCALTSWSDDTIVAIVPSDVAAGPIAVVTSDGEDTTDNSRGPRMPNFLRNSVVRPGLCRAFPAAPGSYSMITGTNFRAAQCAQDASLVCTTAIDCRRDNTYLGPCRFGSVAFGVGNLAPQISRWQETQIFAQLNASTAPNQTVDLTVTDPAGEQSNAIPFTVLPASVVPSIREVTPTSGGPGQYITIRGANFGTEVGVVRFSFLDRNVSPVFQFYTFTPKFPDTCPTTSWWRDDQIILRLPEQLSEWRPMFGSGVPVPADDPNFMTRALGVTVLRRSPQTVSQWPYPTFTATTARPTPGVCSVQPLSGPIGKAVTLLGEHFGGALGTVRFGAVPVLSSATTWGERMVTTAVPAGAQASTAALRLWHRDDDPNAAPEANRGSNVVEFGVFDCRGRNPQCDDVNAFCCPATGTCETEATSCIAAPNTGAYRWTFLTGTAVRAPRVVEACDAATGVASPSPWDHHAGGVAACTNAEIRIEFDKSMALAPAQAVNGVAVYRCEADQNLAVGADVGASAGVFNVWRVASSSSAGDHENNWVTAARAALGNDADGRSYGTGIRLTKKTATVSNPVQVRAAASGIPADATLDRYAYAIEAPADLLTNTNGTTYRVSVQFRGVNAQQNPNMRAGLVIGRSGGPDPRDRGWWQQVAEEAVVGADGTWQTLATAITFDRGSNAGAPGFVRLYVTAPPAGEDTRTDDVYAVEFRSFVLVRDEGDACIERTDAPVAVAVDSTSGPVTRANNVITVTPSYGAWEPGRVYEVIVLGSDEGSRTGVWSADGLFLDGDKDGFEGGNYRFRFRTGAGVCAADRIAQTPRQAVAGEPGPASPSNLGTSANHPGLVHIRASGVSDDAACQTVQLGGVVHWSSDATAVAVADTGGRWCVTSDDCMVATCAADADCGAFGDDATCNEDARRCVGTTFCSAARRCDFTKPETVHNIFSNTATARAVLETGEDPAHVIAREGSARGATDVTVAFVDPKLSAVYPVPACTAACLNPAIIAMVNVDLAPESVAPMSTDFRTVATPEDIVGTVGLYRCADGQCVVSEMTLVPLTGAHACRAGEVCSGRFGPSAQIVATPPALQPNTTYRIIMTRGITSVYGAPLAGAAASGVTPRDLDLDGTPDAWEWMFTTGAAPCAVADVAISPDPVSFTYVGERRMVQATPLSMPDACSPGGQPLVADLNWNWEVANVNVANFTTVVSTSVPGIGAFSTGSRLLTAPPAGPACTVQCFLPGSRRLSGICGNGVIEAPAEECESVDGTLCDSNTCLRKPVASVTTGGTCGDGTVEDGEECDAVSTCDSGSSAGAVCTSSADCGGAACSVGFPDWYFCDATCRNKGSGFSTESGGGVSVCGSRTAAGGVASSERGEDCEDGNTVSGDGCSSRCLAEGTPPLYHATLRPNGLVARCGDGVIADGQWTRTSDGVSITLYSCDGSETGCDAGHAPAAGEECDLGAQASAAWAAARCSYQRCVLTGTDSPLCGNGTRDQGEQCDDGNAANGDGCSSRCLREGASFQYRDTASGAPTPSVCGDGLMHTGEACDGGNQTGYPDAAQLLEAVGGAPAVASGKQETTASATVTGTTASTVFGVALQCGFTNDAQCAGAGAGIGVNRNGCCERRPTVMAGTAQPTGTEACLNARVRVRFDTTMDPASVGVVVTASNRTPIGAALLRCETGAACGETAAITGAADTWEPVNATPRFVAVTDPVFGLVHELEFVLHEPLVKDRDHRVALAGVGTPDSTPLRSANGVAFDNTDDDWTFTTSTDARVCTLDALAIVPGSVLIQSPADLIELRAEAFHGSTPIVPISGIYAWEHTWKSTEPVVAVVEEAGHGKAAGQLCGNEGASACASRSCPEVSGQTSVCTGPAAYTTARAANTPINGTAFALVTAAITDDDVQDTEGNVTSASAKLTVFLCENLWPAVAPRQAWDGHAITGEDVRVKYCRDFGSARVCRAPSTLEALDAPTCASDTDCDADAGERCLLARRDDLPALTPVTGVTASGTLLTGTDADGSDELRREIFLLPRTAPSGAEVTYCSGSGERCDPSLAGFCPAGEFCRPGRDAIGLRFYENEAHVSADRWYAARGFTETTEPATVDGYRAVRAGRSVYVHAPRENLLTSTVAVLSMNDGANEETQAIFQRILAHLSFNASRVDANTRRCVDVVGRCTKSAVACAADTDCGASGGTCDLAQRVACTSDLDCRVGATVYACTAPKDKLRRDLQRAEDLAGLLRDLAAYGRGRGRCAIADRSCTADADCPTGESCVQPTPELFTGTFLPGFTTSRWPSWQQELGRALGITLPTDPLNVFGGQCVVGTANDLYEQATCWNATSSTYTCPAASSVYQYRRTNGVTALGAMFEHAALSAWQPPLELNDALTVETNICAAGAAYGAGAPVCGDRVEQVGEACEPSIHPTDTPVVCAPATGGTGSQFRTCQVDCTWSGLGTCQSRCGNGLQDTGEQCDVGAAGGRVPAGHPQAGTVPGITSGTQYACTGVSASIACQWTGGLCGNGTLEAAYGEGCDIDANTASDPADSRKNKQYDCTPVTDAQPCQPRGGWCGNRTVESPETCDGYTTQSCIVGGDDETGIKAYLGSAFRVLGAGLVDSLNSDATLDATGAEVRGETGAQVEAQYANRISSGASSVGNQYPDAAMTVVNSVWYIPMALRDASDVRVVFTTSSNGASVESLRMTELGANASDYNPDGIRGTGVYHRLFLAGATDDVNVPPPVAPATTSVMPSGSLTTVFYGPFWVRATALVNLQRTEILLTDVPVTTKNLVLVWNNDVNSGTVAAGGYDSNLVVHTVELQSIQTRECSNACTFAGNWSACRAASVSCGNGVPNDPGEACDDSRDDGAFAGRCVNDPRRRCWLLRDGTPEGCAPDVACDPDVDRCTSRCALNACGDGFVLAPTCTAGPGTGAPCVTNGDCGAGGVCGSESCDQGVVGNWLPAPCSATDPLCITQATCGYDRTCNYCTAQQCSIVTRRGGYCGDGIVDVPVEVCDGSTCNATCSALL